VEISKQHRNDIQGVRALAVLSVIIFHLNKGWLPGGFVGVDIFFVISGYLVTDLVLRRKIDGGFSFFSFYLSRIKRIVPVYLAVLAITSCVMALLLVPRDFGLFLDSLKSSLFFYSNHYFATQGDYFSPASHELPLLHTWSLSIEMQFYLLLPFLLVLVSARALRLIVPLGIVVFVLYVTIKLGGVRQDATYFSLLARVPEFLIGSLLAIMPIGQKLSYKASSVLAVFGVLLIALSLWLITGELPFPGLLSLPPCLGVCCLIVSRDNLISRLLAAPIMVYVGALSYSLYLWHWPILAGLRYYYETYALPIHAVALFGMLLAILSVLSYRFIETPFRAGRGAQGVTRLAVFLLCLGMFIIAAPVMNSAVGTPLPIELTRYAAPGSICHGEIVGDCLHGDLSANREILLLGDSHAAQLNGFSDVLGKSLPARIRVITASSCVPIHGFDLDRLPAWAREQCRSQIDIVKNYIDSADIIMVAGMWQYQSASDRFMQALDGFITAASARNQRIIVLAQIPMLTSNVQRMYRFAEFGRRPEANLEGTWQAANSKVAELVGAHTNARFLDFSSMKLFAATPFSNGVLIYQDSHHLNELGSHAYGEAAKDYIRDEVAAFELFNSNPKGGAHLF